MFLNHYHILGVAEDADLPEITAAWKRLMKKYHPDLNQNDEDANEQAKIVNAAFAVLSDSEKRKKFDELLSQRRREQEEQDPEPETESAENESFADLDQTQAEFSDAGATSSFAQSSRNSFGQKYSSWMTMVGVLLAVLTAVPMGIFLIWMTLGFDPLGIFRKTTQVAEVPEGLPKIEQNSRQLDKTNPDSGDAKPNGANSSSKESDPAERKRKSGQTPSKQPKVDDNKNPSNDKATSTDVTANQNEEVAKTSGSVAKATVDPTFVTPFTVPEISITQPKRIPLLTDVSVAKTKLAGIFKVDYELAKKAKGAERLKRLKVVADSISKLLVDAADEVSAYATYEIAIDITKESCFAKDTLKLVDQFEKQFAIDGLRLRLDLFEYWLDQLPMLVKDRAERQASFGRMSVLIRPFLQTTILQNDWQLANQFAEISRRYAVGAGNREEGIKFTNVASTMSRLASTEIQVNQLIKELESNPSQPEKNLRAGQYYCFLIEDWPKGLPFLKASGDQQLSACASADLSCNPENYLKVGDLWWDLGVKENDKDFKSAMYGRADTYYRLALTDSSGVERVRLTKRINEARVYRRTIVLGARMAATKESPTTGMKFVRIYAGKFGMGETQANIREFGGHAREYRHGRTAT